MVEAPQGQQQDKLDNTLCLRRNKMRITLIANDGFMYTNGQACGKIVDLADCDTADNWYEISEEEYQNILNQSDIELKEEN
jgi:hypothetical protein